MTTWWCCLLFATCLKRCFFWIPFSEGARGWCCSALNLFFSGICYKDLWGRKQLEYCGSSQIMKGIRPQLETGYLRSSDCHLEISVLFKKKKKVINQDASRTCTKHSFFPDWKASWGNGYNMLTPVIGHTVVSRDLLLAVFRNAIVREMKLWLKSSSPHVLAQLSLKIHFGRAKLAVWVPKLPSHHHVLLH